MAKYLDETGLQIVWNKCKNTFVSKPLTKTYSNLIASESNESKASFYFGKIVPSDFNKEWAVRYLITASIVGTGTGASNGRSFYEILITGNQSEVLAYRTLNSIYKTSTLPIKNHAYYMANSVGVSTYGHLFGVDLTGSYSPTDGAYKREVIVTIMETANCDVTLFDNATLYENASGTGDTNYSTRETINAYSDGMNIPSIESLVVDNINAKGGNIYMNDRVVFNYSTDMKGDVYVGGWSDGSAVSGQTASLRVNGTNQITGNSVVGGSLDVSGTLNAYGQAYVSGNANFGNNVNISGSVTIGGTTRTQGDLKTYTVYADTDNQYNLGKSGHGYKQGLIYTLNTNKIHYVDGNYDYTFPSKGGTFAMTSDIKTYTNGSGLKLNGDVFSLNTDFVTSGKNYKVQVDPTSGGAYVNVPWTDAGGTITSITVNGATTGSGGVTINVPTKTSDLTNDSGYITDTVNNFTVNNNLNLTQNAYMKYNSTEECIDFIFN